jgi:hypothetical protein
MFRCITSYVSSRILVAMAANRTTIVLIVVIIVVSTVNIESKEPTDNVAGHAAAHKHTHT